MSRSARVVPAALLTVALALTLTSYTDGGGDAERAKGFAGLRDPYFPRLGNGGYDVTHYALTLGYDPDARVRLRATAVVTARATRDLGVRGPHAGNRALPSPGPRHQAGGGDAPPLRQGQRPL